jgi:acetyl esterase/lipase
MLKVYPICGAPTRALRELLLWIVCGHRPHLADIYFPMKYLFLLCLTLAFVSTDAPGGEPAEILKIWTGKAPGAQIDGEEVDRTKPTDNQVGGKRLIRLGNVSEPTISVYPAPKKGNTGAAVVICPGGGYNILAWDLEGTEVAEWLNTIGVTGIVLKYRVPTSREKLKWETPLMDAQRSMSLVRSKAKKWGIDPDRIGILGFSAGGNLAGLTSTRFAERAYEAKDAVDEISSRPDFACLIYAAWLNKRKTVELQDFVPVSAKTPPMFLAHAADDRVECESSIAMFLALKNHKVPAELHVYDGGGHGYGLRRTKFMVTSWPDRFEEWLGYRGFLK